MSHLKICGTTHLEDALFCDQLGVDFLGFIFYKGSKRYITPALARPIIEKLQYSKAVGVFVDETKDQITKIAQDLKLWGVQIYQDFDFAGVPFKVIRALNVKESVVLPQGGDFILLDRYDPQQLGGTGKSFDWRVLPQDLSRVFLAGGINVDNIEQALAKQPFAIDLVSGVEAYPGKKDFAKLIEINKRMT